jgi:hypothetical protein
MEEKRIKNEKFGEEERNEREEDCKRKRKKDTYIGR